MISSDVSTSCWLNYFCKRVGFTWPMLDLNLNQACAEKHGPQHYSVLERGRVNPTRSRPPSSSVNPNPNPFLVISGNQNSGLSFRSVPSQNLKSEPLSSPATRVLSFAATICYRKPREDLLPSIFSSDLQQSLSLFFSETEPSRCGPLSLSLSGLDLVSNSKIKSPLLRFSDLQNAETRVSSKLGSKISGFSAFQIWQWPTCWVWTAAEGKCCDDACAISGCCWSWLLVPVLESIAGGVLISVEIDLPN